MVNSRPPAIGRSAINEFRKARAQFRRDRAAADAAREDRPVTVTDEPVQSEQAVPAVELAMGEPLVLLAHGEPLSLALSRRRRDESASLDRRLRLSRLVAREDRVNETIAELAAADMIDLRDGEVESETLAPVVDLRERAEARAEAADSPN
jgi:hypothetical protein